MSMGDVVAPRSLAGPFPSRKLIIRHARVRPHRPARPGEAGAAATTCEKPTAAVSRAYQVNGSMPVGGAGASPRHHAQRGVNRKYLPNRFWLSALAS